MKYIYGMLYRGFSIGCQPMDGLIGHLDGNKRYFDILVYNRPLTDKELNDYEIEFICKII